MNLIWVCPPPGDGDVILAQSSSGHVTMATIRRVGEEWEFTFDRGARDPGPYRAIHVEKAKYWIKRYLEPRLPRLLRPDEACTWGLPAGGVIEARDVDALGRPWPEVNVRKRPTRRRYR